MYVVTLSVFHNLAIWLLYVNKPEPAKRTQLHEQRWRGVQLTDSIWPSFGHVLNITWPQAWWSSPLASETSQLI